MAARVLRYAGTPIQEISAALCPGSGAAWCCYRPAPVPGRIVVMASVGKCDWSLRVSNYLTI